MRLAPVCAVSLLLLAGCVTTSSAIDRAPAPPPKVVERGPLLWKATRGPLTAYLFGTIHLAPPDFRLDRAVERAFAEAQELMVEVDLTPEEEQALQQQTSKLGMLPPGESLGALLSTADREALEALCVDLKLAPSAVDRMRPWLAELSLEYAAAQRSSARFRLSEQHGLDRRLLTASRARGTPIRSLETGAFQLSLFQGGTAEEQLASLTRTLRTTREGTQLRDLIKAYTDGDAEGVDALAREGTDAPLLARAFERVITDRNRTMFEAVMKALVAGKLPLVAVGAAHLVGRGGLVERFQHAGFEVRRVAAEGPGALYVPPWHTVREEGFSASFPGVPVRQVTPIPGGGSALTLVRPSGEHAYSVEASRIPNLGGQPLARRSAVLRSVADAIAKGRAVDDLSPLTWLGEPALRVRASGGTPTVRLDAIVFTRGDVLYVVRTASTAASLTDTDRADFTRFIDGVKLEPRAGTREPESPVGRPAD